jgi:hypothetical protein
MGNYDTENTTNLKNLANPSHMMLLIISFTVPNVCCSVNLLGLGFICVQDKFRKQIIQKQILAKDAKTILQTKDILLFSSRLITDNAMMLEL